MLKLMITTLFCLTLGIAQGGYAAEPAAPAQAEPECPHLKQAGAKCPHLKGAACDCPHLKAGGKPGDCPHLKGADCPHEKGNCPCAGKAGSDAKPAAKPAKDKDVKKTAPPAGKKAAKPAK